MGQVFISYSRKDSDFVDRLVRDLGQNGVDVWIDRTGIGGGDKWRANIVQAISACDGFLVVLSPQSIASDSVSKEVSLAEKHSRHIIPLRYQPCELPPNLEYQLAELNWIDFAEGYEPSFNAIVKALGTGKPIAPSSRPADTPAPPPFPTPPGSPPQSLAQILPGRWQIQFGTPIGGILGQLTIDLMPNGSFAGQLMTPMGMSQVSGGWLVNPMTELVLQGQQTNGFQVGPYMTMVRFTQVTPSLLTGLSSAGEQTVWQKIA
jgi:hypothetical protein